MSELLASALGVVKARALPLVGFALLFRITQVVVLLPLLAMAGRTLTGRPVIDSTELVRFALSPRGVVTLGLIAAALLTLYLMEQAGLAAIAVGHLHGVTVSATDAYHLVGSSMASLLRLAVALLWRGLLILLPMLALAGFLAWKFLRNRDIHYYLDLKPPAAIAAAALLGVVILATAITLAYWVLHWRMAVPLTALEGISAGQALRQSAAIVHPVWLRLALYWLLILGAGALCGSAVAWLVHQAGLTALGSGAGKLGVIVVVVMVAVSTGLNALIGSAMAVTDATLFATAWDALREGSRPALTMRLQQFGDLPDVLRYDHATRIALLASAVLFVLGAVNAWRMSDSLAKRLPVQVTAHRGSAKAAPENSLSAIRQAIVDGADYVEIDVQETSDGGLVLIHDADLARVAGVPRRVTEMTLAEVKEAEIGSRFDPQFTGERIPTLDEALAAVEGKAHLNIELKFFPGEQRLTERVVQAVRARGMSDDVVIQSLNYDAVREVRRLAPRIRVGYLIATPVKHPERLDVDFFAVSQRLIDPAFLLQAHRRGRQVFAWTVNDTTQMVALAGMGVDNLITSVPADAVRVLREHWAKNPVELRLLRLRSWLGG